jgi:transposase
MSTMADTPKRRPRRKFSEEFKSKPRDWSSTKANRWPRSPASSIWRARRCNNWVEQTRADRSGGKTGLTSAEREELTRLRRENRILQEERES